MKELDFSENVQIWVAYRFKIASELRIACAWEPRYDYPDNADEHIN